MEKPPEIKVKKPSSHTASDNALSRQTAPDPKFTEYFSLEAFSIMLDDPDNAELMLRDPEQTKCFSPEQITQLGVKYKRLGLAILHDVYHRTQLNLAALREIIIALLTKMSVSELASLKPQDKVELLKCFTMCASKEDLLRFTQDNKIQALLKNLDVAFANPYESANYFILNIVNAYYDKQDDVEMRAFMCSFFRDEITAIEIDCLTNRNLSLLYGQTEVLKLLRILFTNATDLLHFLKQSLPIERENYFVIHPLKHMPKNMMGQLYDDSLQYAIQISQCTSPLEILEPILATPGVFSELQEALATVVAITLLEKQPQATQMLSLFEHYSRDGLVFSLRNGAILRCFPENGIPYLRKQFSVHRENLVPMLLDNPAMTVPLRAAKVFPEQTNTQPIESLQSIAPAPLEGRQSAVSAKAMLAARSPALHKSKPAAPPKTTFAEQLSANNINTGKFILKVDMSDENRPKLFILHDKVERYTKAEVESDSAQLQKLKDCLLRDSPVNYSMIIDSMKIINHSTHGIHTSSLIIEFTSKDAFTIFVESFEKLGFYIHSSEKDKLKEREVCCVM